MKAKFKKDIPERYQDHLGEDAKSTGSSRELLIYGVITYALQDGDDKELILDYAKSVSKTYCNPPLEDEHVERLFEIVNK